MVFGKDKEQQRPQEPADIPSHLTDLHCFTETEGVVTTSKSVDCRYGAHGHKRRRKRGYKSPLRLLVKQPMQRHMDAYRADG